jgi:hypothetical protein
MKSIPLVITSSSAGEIKKCDNGGGNCPLKLSSAAQQRVAVDQGEM